MRPLQYAFIVAKIILSEKNCYDREKDIGNQNPPNAAIILFRRFGFVQVEITGQHQKKGDTNCSERLQHAENEEQRACQRSLIEISVQEIMSADDANDGGSAEQVESGYPLWRSFF